MPKPTVRTGKRNFVTQHESHEIFKEQDYVVVLKEKTNIINHSIDLYHSLQYNKLKFIDERCCILMLSLSVRVFAI